MKKGKKSAINFFEDFGLLFLSIALFVGGIYILSLKEPFWSLFLGIASIQVGIVLIILTFDSFIKRKIRPVTEDYKTLACLVCKRPTFVPKYQNVTLCDDCQVRVANTFKAATLVVFALVTLTATIGLVSMNQDFRRQAAEKQPIYVCDEGSWLPADCRCGAWSQNSCPEGTLARTCMDGQIYCCEKGVDAQGDTWNCLLVDQNY